MALVAAFVWTHRHLLRFTPKISTDSFYRSNCLNPTGSSFFLFSCSLRSIPLLRLFRVCQSVRFLLLSFFFLLLFFLLSSIDLCALLLLLLFFFYPTDRPKIGDCWHVTSFGHFSRPFTGLKIQLANLIASQRVTTAGGGWCCW